MANHSIAVSPISVKNFTLCGHRYELAWITARCCVVTSKQTGKTWQVAGQAGLKAWRREALRWLKAYQIAARAESTVSAQALPEEHIVPLTDTDPFADKNAFVTPDGRVWPCHNGQHGFTAAKIVADLGEEAVSGALMLGSDGTWMQEGQTGTMTEKQAESVELLAQFPKSGIKTAAIDILSKLAVTVEETPVTAVDASRSQRDSVTVTARRLGDALANEVEQINARLGE